ncbi:MAG: hypothetical protein RLZZ77_561 [Bacteroidota bacterium]|jgi:hypothetical protein
MRLFLFFLINGAFVFFIPGKKCQASSPMPAEHAVETQRVIHVFVALCDNKYQGIVPVPEKIGNGQNPNANLYWGCGYGIRTYFKKSTEWKWLRTDAANGMRLERCIFKHVNQDVYLVADAYDGQYIKTCTYDFLKSSSGELSETLDVNGQKIPIYGGADLIAYIGHNGLMDFTLDRGFVKKDSKQRAVIILACASRNYFKEAVRETGARPILWTTHLMCPEAYTLHDALTGYVRGETDAAIRMRAVKAYQKYQKCSEKGALNLLVTGY